MMNHDGWMGGWAAGGMWLWPVLLVAAVALVVILVMRRSNR